jgi:hypothetical protein
MGDGEPEMVTGGISHRWRDKPISEITGDDLYELVEEARTDGIPGMLRKTTEPSDARARHLAAALGAMFGWLIRHRRIKVNPYSGVYRPPSLKPRQHVLNIRTDTRDADELRWFWKATGVMVTPTGTCADCCC